MTPTNEHDEFTLRALNFTALDFETANGFRGSPCSIGLVRVRGGKEVATFYRVMLPPKGFDRFDPKNVAIHGITREEATQYAEFSETFDDIVAFIGDDALVAHNASFDVEVFESALEVSKMDSPGLVCFCSVQLSRAAYDLKSNALPYAAAEAGFNLKNHHHALEDARAAGAIVCDVARRTGRSAIEDVFGQFAIPPEVLQTWRGQRERESRATSQVRRMGNIFSPDSLVADESLPDLMRWQDEGKNLPPSLDADRLHPLYGQSLVFTGNLAISRSQAKELSAQCGASMSSKVNATTTMLIVGDAYDDDLPQGSVEALQTNKAREALRRRDSGQQIMLVSETRFKEYLGAAWPLASD